MAMAEGSISRLPLRWETDALLGCYAAKNGNYQRFGNRPVDLVFKSLGFLDLKSFELMGVTYRMLPIVVC
jgi:hypothetical protein